MTEFSYAGLNGIFPSQWIEQAIATKTISANNPITPAQVQPNSLDLRLGTLAYRVNCSFLPGPEGIEKKLSRFKWYEIPLLDDGVVLEINQVYIVPLQEHLSLPSEVSGAANPKSSTGRLDVFTRVVTDSGRAFDEVPAGYKGMLYLEIVPRSFPIIVRPGDCLAQVRFAIGNARLSRDETASLLNTEDIILSSRFRPLRDDELRIASGVSLSVELRYGSNKARRVGGQTDSTIGFKARKNQPPIDLRDIGKVPIRRYWERIYYRSTQPVILEPDEFYIFASRELVRLPPGICAEMKPFDAASGELRTHYAGFFDSGFGFSTGIRSGQTAAAVVLEIRNRDVPFLIEEGQPLFQLEMLRNTEPPDRLYGLPGSNYQNQRLKLSKQFTRTDDEDEDDLPAGDEHPSLGL